MVQDELHNDEWLLAWEGNFQGWLPSIGGADHVNADPAFTLLKKARVSF